MVFVNGGFSATTVIGQADFVSSDANRGAQTPAANTLSAPEFMSWAPNGDIWVVDTGNNVSVVFVFANFIQPV